MFTGIIEAVAPSVSVTQADQCLRLEIKKPKHFDDLSVGDSVACNGICLTIENFSDDKMAFALGFETLKVTDWQLGDLQKKEWNLERSLRFGDRVHGHLVSGHVDGMAKVLISEAKGDSWILRVQVPQALQRHIWQKSSLTLQGVSLTVNQVEDGEVEVCLVPETLKKTNLKKIKVGDHVTVETDYYMKGLLCTQPTN